MSTSVNKARQSRFLLGMFLSRRQESKNSDLRINSSCSSVNMAGRIGPTCTDEASIATSSGLLPRGKGRLGRDGDIGPGHSRTKERGRSLVSQLEGARGVFLG